MARFAPLYQVEIQDATVDVRGSFSPAEKFGFQAPVGALEEGDDCAGGAQPHHSSQSLRAEVPVRLLARLNGDELEPWRPTGRS